MSKTRKGDGLRKGSPIIVGGFYRSGTTLVRYILDTHSRIYCGPEVKFFLDFYGDYLNDPIRPARFMTSARRMLPEKQLLRVLGRTFVVLHEKAAARAGKPRWADKTPENVLYLEDWQHLLDDNWVFVHVVRNPLDTLASLGRVTFSPLVFPSELGARIDLYKRYTQAGLDFGRLHPERYYRVVYERLVDQPKPVISSLMDWLEESFETKQLDFNSVRHQTGLGGWEVRKTTAVHAESVGRWKKLLLPSEVEQIYRECGPLWQRIVDDEAWAPRG